VQPTKDQSKQLAALDAILDEDIDLNDIPEQGSRTEWIPCSGILPNEENSS
jgi:hypothetical protein